MAYRILIADSEPVVRIGLAAVFSGTDIEITALAASAKELISIGTSGKFDLILSEIQFSDGSGFDAVSALRRNQVACRILFFSSSAVETSYIRAIAAGADSYLLKTVEPAELLRTIRVLADAPPHEPGEKPDFFAGELTHLAQAVKSRTRPAIDCPLTERQIQILRCIASGLGNKEIASLLKIKVDTVKEHIRNILRAIGANDRTAAAVWAIRNKLIR